MYPRPSGPRGAGTIVQSSGLSFGALISRATWSHATVTCPAASGSCMKSKFVLAGVQLAHSSLR
jgi:hypothetical protein